MLAIQIRRHGGPEELVVTERADPVPAAGEVVVRNRWIGVNYVDLQHREGRPYPVQLPLIPGTEAAGRGGAGPGADREDGTPVAHRPSRRGLRELTAVPLEFVVPLPQDAALDIAAAVGGTTGYVLADRPSGHRVPGGVSTRPPEPPAAPSSSSPPRRPGDRPSHLRQGGSGRAGRQAYDRPRTPPTQSPPDRSQRRPPTWSATPPVATPSGQPDMLTTLGALVLCANPAARSAHSTRAGCPASPAPAAAQAP